MVHALHSVRRAARRGRTASGHSTHLVAAHRGVSAVPTLSDWCTVLLRLFEGLLALHGHRVMVTAGDQ